MSSTNDNMSETPKIDENTGKTPKCEVEIVPSEDKGWKLIVKSSPACEEALQKIYFVVDSLVKAELEGKRNDNIR